MNPQEPQQQNYQPPTEPAQQSYQPPATPQVARPIAVVTPKNSHKKLALLLLIGPTALCIIAIIGYFIANFISGSLQPDSSTDLFPQQNPVSAIFNILFFLMGIVSILTWLPGLVIGIVLLAKQPK